MFSQKIYFENNVIIFRVALFLIFLASIFGRSFLGLYIFDFRIGEFIVGFGFIYSLTIFIYRRYYKVEFSSFIVNSYFLLIMLFLLNIFFDNSQNFTTYIFQSSSYIWYISYLFLGYNFFKSFKINKKYFVFGYVGLFFVYFLNTIYFPDIIQNIFQQYSDKFQFNKASEISIFYICITFFSNRLNYERKYFDIFIITSSLILPIVIFKSRSAAIAVVLFFVFEVISLRKNLYTNSKRNIFIVFLFVLLFSFTSHNLVDNIYTIDETEQAIAGVFTHKYVYSNTYDGKMPLFYIFEDRLFSADGNLNWRLQLWQDGLHSVVNENKTIFGFGYKNPVPIFNDLNYSTLDGNNKNAHNYFLNVLFTGGISALLLVIYFFYSILNTKKLNHYRYFLNYLFPLTFISLFDGSMENPYFGLMFYFMLSIFFVNKNNIMSKT